MKLLLDEDNRVLSSFSDEDVINNLPDPRWHVINVSSETVLEGDNIDNQWNGTRLIYNPKKYN